MPISVGLYRFGDNLLHILISCFHHAVHLGAIWYRVMMFDHEPGAYLCHHVVIQVKTIFWYDSLWKSVSTYEFFLDESGHHCLRHTSIWCCLYPLGKVVDDYKDETITSMPHIKKGHGDTITYVQGRRWNVYLICVDLTLMAFSNVIDAIIF